MCTRTCNPIAVQAKRREVAITLKGEAGDIAPKGQYWQYWQAVELKHVSEKDPIRAYADMFMWRLPHAHIPQRMSTSNMYMISLPPVL
jgi:hypothetical protein